MLGLGFIELGIVAGPTAAGILVLVMMRRDRQNRKVQTAQPPPLHAVRCPYCGDALHIPAQYLGAAGTCTHCGGHIEHVGGADS